MDTTPGTSPTPPPAARVPARRRVYEALRAELLTASVAPFQRFTEENVADRFSVSRTPVRDALVRLQADGLLVKRDGALYRYLPSLAEFTDLYELRVLLECAGIDRAIADPTIRHDRAGLEAELARWHERADAAIGPDPGFVDADEAFHLALLSAAGNAQVVRSLEDVNRRIRPVRMHDYLTQDRVDATIAEHIEILDHTLAGRLGTARDALRVHVGQSQSIVQARAARAMQLAQMS